MTRRGNRCVLLIGSDPAIEGALRRLTEGADRPLVVVARGEAEAWLTLERQRPDVVVAHSRSIGSVSRFIRGLRSLWRSAPPLLLLVVEPGGSAEEPGSAGPGPDCWVRTTADPEELHLRVKLLLRVGRLRAQVRAARREAAGTRTKAQHRLYRFIAMLIDLIDLAIPGAGDRGDRIARIGRCVAARFEVPRDYTFHFELAARLHEIGRLALRSIEPRNLDAGGGEKWRYALASHTILSGVDELRNAADLIAATYENWDGTGFPRHLMRGQIPLRARILRVVIEFLEEVEVRGEEGVQQILQDMSELGGTRYDPVVLLHLQAALSEISQTRLVDLGSRVGIDELKEGMVLAEDLYTCSGTKLLSRETVLTRTLVEAVRWRDRYDPVLRDPIILRRIA